METGIEPGSLAWYENAITTTPDAFVKNTDMPDAFVKNTDTF